MSEHLDTLPDHELSTTEAYNYLLVLGFSEHRNTLAQGIDEDARSWVDFYDGIIKQLRAHE